MLGSSRLRCVAAFLATLSLGVGTGCTTYRAMPAGPTAGSYIRLESSAPITVHEGRTVATTSACRARRVFGVVEDMRGDTITLGAKVEIEHSDDAAACKRIAVASLIAPQGTKVTSPAMNVGGTLSVLVVIALAAVAAMGAALNSRAKHACAGGCSAP